MTKPAGGDTSCRVVCQVPSGHEVKARAGSPVENVTVVTPRPQKWCGPNDGEGTARPFVSICDNALSPYKPARKSRTSLTVIAGGNHRMD